ncbi:hypothetical protein [Flavobacterium sp.]|uniref:hypothetical protein n=1 Tax=Flavobacterium sp. TaxID=239 RepID=UPI0038D13BA8
MRKINYKSSRNNEYQRYVDIGSCEKHYSFLPLYDDEKMTFDCWINEFINQPLGVQMLTIHYYLYEINSESYIPIVLKKKLLDNMDLFKTFCNKWFNSDIPDFKGLDLNKEGIEDKIIDEIEDENGIISSVKFSDGSSLEFLDENDNIPSFYIKEIDYINLKNEFNLLLGKLIKN